MYYAFLTKTDILETRARHSFCFPEYMLIDITKPDYSSKGTLLSSEKHYHLLLKKAIVLLP